MGLILEDEARHHRMFSELITTLRGTVERTDGVQVPSVLPVPDHDAVLEATKRLLERERRRPS